MPESFLMKLQTEACNLMTKETLTQLFSCEFCEILNVTNFIELFRATASATLIMFLNFQTT